MRDHFQSTVPQLFNILYDKHCILYLRNMFATFRQNRILNKDRFDVLSIPNYVIKKKDHGSKEFTTKLTTQQGRHGPMEQRDDYQEANIIYERLYEQHGKGNTRLHPPRIKFHIDEVNNLPGPKRIPSVSTPKRVRNGTTIHQQILHPQVDRQLHGGNIHHGTSDIFQRTQGVFAYKRVNTRHETRTQCQVIRLAKCSTACLVISPHMHDTCMWLKSQWSVVFAKTFVFTLSAAWHTVHLL